MCSSLLVYRQLFFGCDLRHGELRTLHNDRADLLLALGIGLCCVHLLLGLAGLGLTLLGGALVLRALLQRLRLILGLAFRALGLRLGRRLLDGQRVLLAGLVGIGARVVREHGHVQEREHQQHRQQD